MGNKYREFFFQSHNIGGSLNESLKINSVFEGPRTDSI